MGLREDFRSALASIAAAAPEAVRTMRHGDAEQGAVVQSSARDFAEPVSDSAPAEAARFVANAADFPSLDEGAAVELVAATAVNGGISLRVVTSLKTDAVGATLTIGLSPEFEKCPSSYSGTRRADGATRRFSHPLDILILENGVADNVTEAFAPTYATSYTVAIRRTDWPDTSDPEPADQIEVAPHGHPFAIKVSTVTRHDGWYLIKCRTRS